VKQCVKKPQNIKQKIVIIGDSHTRNSAAERQHNLGSTFTVSSCVKPGAGMGNIVESMNGDIKKLKSDGVVVIWGGSNDISKNNSKEALKHLCNFIKNNQKVNIVVMTAPPRHDLPPASGVNSEVIRFNKQMRKRMIQFNIVKILETDIERKYFTKHGLHLNSSGKEYIAIRLATVVKSLFHVERMSPISLQWKEDSPVSSNKVESTPQIQPPHSPKESSTNENSIESEPNDRTQAMHMEEKKSNRTKKAPLTRSDDFLWM